MLTSDHLAGYESALAWGVLYQDASGNQTRQQNLRVEGMTEDISETPKNKILHRRRKKSKGMVI